MSNDLVQFAAAGGPDALSKLMDVVKQGVGIVADPLKTILQAKADVIAAGIRDRGGIGNTERLERAVARLVHIEMSRQENIDDILSKAKLALPQAVSGQPVDSDWIKYFFDACQHVSQSDMQNMWANILAREVSEPGSTPKRALEFLKTLERQEAEMFEKLLAIALQDENGWTFIIEDKATFEALYKLEPKHAIIRHLTDIGLLAAENALIKVSLIANRKLSYDNNSYRFVGPPVIPTNPNSLSLLQLEKFVVTRNLTQIGQALSKVGNRTSIGTFISDLSANLTKEVGVRIEATRQG